MKNISCFLLIMHFACTAGFSFDQDSLRNINTAYVTVGDDTVFVIHADVGSYKPSERADVVRQRLALIRQDITFSPDSLYISHSEQTSDVMFRDRVILSVTDGDAAPLNKSRREVAAAALLKLKTALDNEQKSRSIIGILVKIGLTLLELLILYFLIRYLNRLFNYTKRWLIRKRQSVLRGIRFKGYELLDTNRELQAALFLNNVLRWFVIVFVLYIAIPILFSIFPWTRGLADRLFDYILSPVRGILLAVINYIPNLFTIAVIYLAIHYTVRFFKVLANEIEKGSLVIHGFYPDWAMPTFGIIRILLYAFMFIAIFKYLPGSDSPVFQGVSVFLGILFSLGSSSAVGNAVAGLVITYMRPFKVGDRIRIGEITGDVIEKSILVTRIRTIKNENITVPNSTVLSSHTINFTTSAMDLGLILYTSVTIGYDVPWKKVHELLVQAALRTDGIIANDENRKPYVLQTSLDDFYVSYQVNGYTEQSHRMAAIYSALHQNIQNTFNEAGVEIMSPHYRAQRDGNESTVNNQ